MKNFMKVNKNKKMNAMMPSLLMVALTMVLPISLNARPVCVELVNILSGGAYVKEMESEIARAKSNKDLQISKVRLEFETRKAEIRSEFNQRKIEYLHGEIETEHSTLKAIEDIERQISDLRETTKNQMKNRQGLDADLIQRIDFALRSLETDQLTILERSSDWERIRGQIGQLRNSMEVLTNHKPLNVDFYLFDIQRSFRLLKIQSLARFQTLNEHLKTETVEAPQEGANDSEKSTTDSVSNQSTTK